LFYQEQWSHPLLHHPIHSDSDEENAQLQHLRKMTPPPMKKIKGNFHDQLTHTLESIREFYIDG